MVMYKGSQHRTSAGYLPAAATQAATMPMSAITTLERLGTKVKPWLDCGGGGGGPEGASVSGAVD